MAPPQIVPRAGLRSADRLDRDRQAAPQCSSACAHDHFTGTAPRIATVARRPGAQFGVSSTPIRDALMRLEEEGLVDVFPQYATVVAGRCTAGAAGAFPAAGGRTRDRARACDPPRTMPSPPNSTRTVARQQQFAKAGDFEKFMAADNEFHAQLYAATDKQDIWSLVRSRSGHIDRLRRLHLPSPGKAQDIVRHHKLIAKAIDAGEPDEAQKHLRTHLSEHSANSPRSGRVIRNI